MKKLSFRVWLSIITFILIGLILYASRKEIVQAWHLMKTVDLRILFVFILVSLVSYISAGEMIFSYLRKRGNIEHVSLWTLIRISIELNFVNHVLPSGGVSGISYVNWRLGKFGISAGKATIAQVVRYFVGYIALTILLAIAVLAITIDGTVNRWIILLSSSLVFITVLFAIGVVYFFKDKSRMQKIEKKLIYFSNEFVKKITFGRVDKAIRDNKLVNFFEDMRDDYLEIMQNKSLLKIPVLWGILFTVAEVALFWIVFWALGSPINPAPILIAYGLASLAGFIVVTPGGTGAYETIMVFVLAIAGMSSDAAIAGIVLTRIIILSITILVGWILYQQAVIKYGKRN